MRDLNYGYHQWCEGEVASNRDAAVAEDNTTIPPFIGEYQSTWQSYLEKASGKNHRIHCWVLTGKLILPVLPLLTTFASQDICSASLYELLAFSSTILHVSCCCGQCRSPYNPRRFTNKPTKSRSQLLHAGAVKADETVRFYSARTIEHISSTKLLTTEEDRCP